MPKKRIHILLISLLTIHTIRVIILLPKYFKGEIDMKMRLLSIIMAVMMLASMLTITSSAAAKDISSEVGKGTEIMVTMRNRTKTQL